MTTTILSLLSREALAELYARGLWRAETIHALALRNAAERPGGTALRDRHRHVSWAGLVAAADALAADLAARGLRPGQRVTFWMPDRIESVVAMLACWRAGYVVCPSPHRNHTLAEVSALVERMRAAAFIYETGFGADLPASDDGSKVEEAIAAAGCVRHVYRLSPVTAADAGRRPFAGQLGAGEGLGPPPVHAEPDRVSYIAFTSGSTGAPKGVMHSDNTLLVCARAICRDWAIDAQSVVCTMSPFSHNLGIGAMLTALVAGAELVIHDTPRGGSVVDRLVETGVTYLVGVPTHAIDLVAELRRRGISRPGRLRAFRISGAASPPQVMRDLIGHGVEPQSGYGMTENNAHQYTRRGDDPELIAGSCGRACDGYEIRILDPANPDRALPPGEVGLVAGRGACLMLGYFDDQRATEAAFNADGWFMTGDLGTLDAYGYLRLTGRQKEVLIRGGHNISPARIEELAAGVPGIARAAVLALPDPRLGERICLAYVLGGPGSGLAGGLAVDRTSPDGHDGPFPSPVALLSALAASGLSRFELPEFMLPLAELPLMANGKIDKPRLLAQVTAGTLKPQPVAPRRG